MEAEQLREQRKRDGSLNMTSDWSFWATNVRGWSTVCAFFTKFAIWLVTRNTATEKFELFAGIIIICNCGMLGIEAELTIGNFREHASVLRIIDNLFSLVFNLEILVRFYAIGWRSYLFGPDGTSNIFDTVLVLVTDVVWMMSSFMSDGLSPDQFIRSFTTLRTVRLARLVRLVQRVPFFREVWILLRGVTQSFRVLLWTIFVVALITYVFAIFGVVLVSVDVKEAIAATIPVHSLSPQQLDMLWESTGGVLTWMYTLVQVLTLDSWNSILRPLMLVAPWSWLLFYIYIALAVMVVLNLVTAIIVESAFMHSHRDEEEHKAELENARLESIAKLKSLFVRLDDDDSGDISWPEFEAGFSKPEIRHQMEELEIREEQLKPLFDLLDCGSGVLSLEEFFTGIQRLTGTATARETYQIQKRVDQICHVMEHNTNVIEMLVARWSDDVQGPLRSEDNSRVSLKPSNVLQTERERRNMRSSLLIRSSDETSYLTQSRTCFHSGEGEPTCQVASATEDLLREISEKLACQLDAIKEDFRSQCTTLHRQVAERFQVIFDNSDPEVKIFNHRIGVDAISRQLERASGSTLENRSFPHTSGETDGSQDQTLVPPTHPVATPFLVVCGSVVNETPCQHGSFSGHAITTAGGPTLPRHKSLQPTFHRQQATGSVVCQR